MTTKYAPGAPGAQERALGWSGRSYPAGWCLAFQVTKVYLVPGVGDYDGDRSADAEDYWKKAKARGTVVETSDPDSIPAGVMIMWTGGSGDHGHAAYSLGKGRMVSTDAPARGRVDVVDVDWVRAHWGLKLVGYIVVDGNGFTLVQPVEPDPVRRFVKVDRAFVYAEPEDTDDHISSAARGTMVQLVPVDDVWGYSRVNGTRRYWKIADLQKTDPTGRTHQVTVDRLNVRFKPSTSSKLMQTLRRGDLVTFRDVLDAGGRQWGRIGPDRWVATEYTKRV